VQARAGGDEVVDLRDGADRSRDPAAQRPRERVERHLAPATEDEVVRRCPERCADDVGTVLDEPELVRGVEGRRVADRARKPEDQVVPRLVREQRRGPLEEDACVGRLDDLHDRSLRCLGNA
jgi:hypothetical protein